MSATRLELGKGSSVNSRHPHGENKLLTSSCHKFPCTLNCSSLLDLKETVYLSFIVWQKFSLRVRKYVKCKNNIWHIIGHFRVILCLCASSKTFETEFDLHEDNPVREDICQTKTRCDAEAYGNWKLTFSKRNFQFSPSQFSFIIIHVFTLY